MYHKLSVNQYGKMNHKDTENLMQGMYPQYLEHLCWEMCLNITVIPGAKMYHTNVENQYD